MADHQEDAHAPGEAASNQPGETSPADLQEALAAAKSQADEYLRLLQRTKADFVNYQRRSEQERSEQERYAAAGVLLQLLPVIDDLERATAAVPDHLAGEPWVQGILLIERKLKTTLEQVGLRPIEAVGQPFNPLQHEAVGQEPAPPEQEGLVVAEVQRGYRLHDRLLRPARVRVGRSTAEVQA
jgi:molecular chaperone GrpE